MIDIRKDGAIWWLTLNRPEKANSLTALMLQQLIDLVAEAQNGPNVLVLTGTGKVFSAGADLTEAKAGLATSDLWEELSGAIANLPCLTIAALNGTLAGGAFGMALACDLRLAVTGAEFFYPVMKLGFLPQPSDPVRMADLVGPARAKMILLAGQRVPAVEALEWGLINQLTKPEDLTDATLELAADALGADHDHIVAMKHMFS